MALDAAVARTVYMARLLERAAHSTGVWTMSWRGVEVRAERTIGDEGVTFRAEIPALCPLSEAGSDVVELRLDGVLQHVIDVTVPHERGFTVEWTIAPRGVSTPAA